MQYFTCLINRSDLNSSHLIQKYVISKHIPNIENTCLQTFKGVESSRVPSLTDLVYNIFCYLQVIGVLEVLTGETGLIGIASLALTQHVPCQDLDNAVYRREVA